MKTFVLILLSLIILFGCVTQTSSNQTRAGPQQNIIQNARSPEAAYHSALISAKDGGKIVAVTANGMNLASIEIPPGALEKDEKITIIQEKNLVGLPEFYVESNQTQLNSPATITMHYDPSAVPSGSYIAVATIEPNSDGVYVGAELSKMQIIKNVKNDPVKGILSFQTNHFSWFSGYYEKPAYIVLDIPGKYLKKDDILFALTGRDVGGYWAPGHVGMYLGTQDPYGNTNDGDTMIESTPSGDNYSNGVQFSSFNRFKTLPSHLYMGARRPNTSIITQAKLNDVASTAVTLIGQPYTTLGSDWIGGLGGSELAIVVGLTGISCVQLPNMAYKFNNIALVEPEPFILYPIEAYDATLPVDNIQIKEGERFQMKAYGVVAPSYYGINYEGDYTDDSAYQQTTIQYLVNGQPAELPSGMKYSVTGKNAGILNWVPTQDEAGKTYQLVFSTSYVGNMGSTFKADVGTVLPPIKQKLAITVLPVASEPKAPSPDNIQTTAKPGCTKYACLNYKVNSDYQIVSASFGELAKSSPKYENGTAHMPVSYNGTGCVADQTWDCDIHFKASSSVYCQGMSNPDVCQAHYLQMQNKNYQSCQKAFQNACAASKQKTLDCLKQNGC